MLEDIEISEKDMDFLYELMEIAKNARDDIRRRLKGELKGEK